MSFGVALKHGEYEVYHQSGFPEHLSLGLGAWGLVCPTAYGRVEHLPQGPGKLGAWLSQRNGGGAVLGPELQGLVLGMRWGQVGLEGGKWGEDWGCPRWGSGAGTQQASFPV